MVRFILVFVLLLLSLLNVFPAPLNLLWYVSILTTEFCWIFFAATILLMLVRFGSRRYESITLIAGSVALCLFLLPVAFAYRLSAPLRSQFESVFRQVPASNTFPFKLSRMITGIGATQLEPRSMTFSEKDSLDLDWYPSQVAGNRPCVIVIHGGLWAGGGKKQLPELNTYLAMEGYHVVSINYRLAPGHPYPAAIEDVGKLYVTSKQMPVRCI